MNVGRPEPLDDGRLGWKVRASGVESYLRCGWTSWDGAELLGVDTVDSEGSGLTALVGADGGCVVVGFERHDRFHSVVTVHCEGNDVTVVLETCADGVAAAAAEELAVVPAATLDAGLRAWAEVVAAKSKLAPRLLGRRITGWCSWYSLYSSISEATIYEHLDAARAFRDDNGVPLEFFLIDDGFTPEMGDWSDWRPTFPNRQAIVGEIAAAGFVPGLWIAPGLVGNRSRLFREHPDWVVQSVDGGPLVAMQFYGEFRWHKRSEEYHVLDITHPDAERYLRSVLQTWRSWGVGYFKTDFLHVIARFGPDTARWHNSSGLSRVGIWQRFASVIRESIGDAVWLACGAPLWSSVGLADAVRIGSDVGADWTKSGAVLETLRLRATANGVLWQADPDCVLLRERFHDFTDEQVVQLATAADSVGGVLMTSDHLGELSPRRRNLFVSLLSPTMSGCAAPGRPTGRLSREGGATL